MTEFVSEEKIIPHSDVEVFRVLSDLQKLESVKHLVPEDKLSDFSFDADMVTFRFDPLGKVAFLVEEREPYKLIKFKSDKLGFDLFVSIHLEAESEKHTRLRLKLLADLTPFIKGMVEKPMGEALDKITDALVQLPYDRL
ncbi:MAG: SRPBCC family protein [Proteiniphilum sp.]|nr:SRPBCC family protein [Proteiniphilum sp.]